MLDNVIIQVQTDGDGTLPQYAHPGDAGADLCAAISSPTTLYPGERKLITTGLRARITDGFELQIRPRSGFALSTGVTVLNAPGTIDSGYRGIIGVILINHGDKPVTINPGDRIAQAVVAPVIRAVFEERDTLDDTRRGDGGFGSTGM